MELRHIRYFIAVAEELSFSRAAKKLNTAQPSLSQQIRDLEYEVGASLFHRTTRSVVLTEAGRALLPSARSVLDTVSDALLHARRAAEAPLHEIVAGFIPSAEEQILPPLLQLLEHEPENLTLTTIRFDPSLARCHLLGGQKMHVAFLRRLPSDMSALEGEIISTDTVRVVLSATHYLAMHTSISLHELEHLPYAPQALPLDPEAAELIRQFIGSRRRAHGASPTTSSVRSGRAFTLLPSSTSLVAGDGLVSLPLEDSPLLPLAMAWRRDDTSRHGDTIRRLVRLLFTSKHDTISFSDQQHAVIDCSLATCATAELARI